MFKVTVYCSLCLCSLVSFTESHIKKLLPLGFTKKDIRRELFLSNGDLNIAASRLLDQQQRKGGEVGVPSLTSDESWEKMVTEESGEEMMEIEAGKKKSFSVGKIEVSMLHDLQMHSC